jgi:hypothetical protein
MSESTPHYLPVAVLLLLGTQFAVGASLLVSEIDCHIAYSVSGVSQAGFILGPGGERTLADGQGYFVVVNVNTWFDEKTTSPHRGILR